MLKQTKKSIPDPSPRDAMVAASYSSLFESFFLLSTELLCIIDSNGYYKKVNNSWAVLLGYEAAALCNQPLHASVHEDDRLSMLEMISLATEGVPVKEFENRFTCADGSCKWLSCSATLLQKDGLLLVARDVTPKKLAQEELRRKTDEVNMIVSSLDDIVFEFDNELRYKKAWCHNQDLLKIMPRQFLGKTPEEAFAAMPQLAGLFVDDLRQSLEKQEIHYRDFSMQIGNETRWYNSKISPLFKQGVVHQGFTQRITDISERKKVELAVEEKNAELENVYNEIRFQVKVMQDVSDGLIATDLDFKIISFNRAAENMYGLVSQDIMGKPIHTVIKHHYIAGTRDAALQQLFTTGSWNGQLYYDRKDGKRVYMQCALSLVKNEHGRHVGFAGIHHDITERRHSEEALRISEERYRSVVHALGEGIIMQDANGDIIACNQSAEEILGVESKDLVGSNPFRNAAYCIHEDGSIFPVADYPAFRTLHTGLSFQQVIIGVYRRDGTLLWLSLNTEPVYYTDQRGKPDAVVASFVDITTKKAAEIELQRSQQQLREYSERITNILASITDGFIAVNNTLQILLWNHAVESLTGIKANDVIGTTIDKVFPEFIGTREYHRYIRAIDSEKASSFQHFISRFNCWFEASVYPFSQGAFIYFRDITERKKQEQLLELEKRVLEINAESNASLKTNIDFFLEGLEKIFPGILCSILTLNKDKVTVTHLSAPSLPQEFSQAINGMRIGPGAGSCGTAMFTKSPILTTNIDMDPLWDDYRHLARRFGLKACWSFPILDAHEEVLATVAIYQRQPKAPSQKELDVLDRVSKLLRIIIENKNAEARIRVSNERYLLVTKATNDAIWDWDMATNSLYWGEGFYTLFGFKPGYVDNSFGFWESSIHPDDRERVVNGLNEFVKDNNSQVWEDEYRFRKNNGEYALVYDRGFLIFDHTGRINRMVGSVQDITDKKEMERRLLKQELDKQKLVAQAVVNAQEKERADIGKELHDNVNQILSTAKLYLELAKTEESERSALIDRSTDSISDAINEIRNISRSLVPPSVGDLGLIESIQDLVENIKATKKLQVDFYYKGSIDRSLDEKRKLMLFRIIQEQVNNVLRHAQAVNLLIELVADTQFIDLTLTDDGRGFDPEKVKNNKGVGLSNIVSRTELFNGKVTITSAPGKGCKLNINVPIANS